VQLLLAVISLGPLVLTTPGHEDRGYELSGPEPLTAAGRVAVLGQARTLSRWAAARAGEFR
jgi:uncharacterized protein YbjT (DUF2867 family)